MGILNFCSHYQNHEGLLKNIHHKNDIFKLITGFLKTLTEKHKIEKTLVEMICSVKS